MHLAATSVCWPLSAALVLHTMAFAGSATRSMNAILLDESGASPPISTDTHPPVPEGHQGNDRRPSHGNALALLSRTGSRWP